MNAVVVNQFMTLPNLLSLLRIALTPVLLGLIWANDGRGFFWVLVLAWTTDVLDGFLARRLGQVTALGSSLDTIGDLAVMTVVFLGVGCFFPDATHRFGALLAVGFGLIVALQVICCVRFGKAGMFHTWLGKASGVVGSIAILTFFWVGHTNALGYLACGMGLLAQIEQVVIAFMLRGWQTDIVSAWHVFRLQDRRA